MNTQNKTMKIVLAGLFAALTCVATMIIRIPTFKGYVHIGDCMVIASGIILGPVVGGLAAGIGSMLADLLGGYYVFSVATFVIKFLAALAAGFTFTAFQKLFKKYNLPGTILAGLASEIVVVSGYFLFEIFYEGFAAAVAEIFPNCVQGITGLILAAALTPILLKIPMIRDIKVGLNLKQQSMAK
ncbi:MAG: ECF transporter S component [Lachnospiraceae bacterium]|nr:ECF transporter S component [Lachnospiraceae bacterium]